MSDDPLAKVRLDKWLWAARFFKTRSLASAAVSGGKVHVNDARVKPARALKIGDMLSIQRGGEQITVRVRALAHQRRPAKEAILLYEETPQSIQLRKENAEQRRLRAAATPSPGRRPNKQERRRITRFIRRADNVD